MMTETQQRDLDMEALIWKATLQPIERQLLLLKKKLCSAKLHLYPVGTKKILNGFYINAKHYSERIECLKRRISHFENKLCSINEYDTSSYNLELFDEAESISITVKNCNKNVGALASEITVTRFINVPIEIL